MPTTIDRATGLPKVPLWIDGAPAAASPEATFPVYSSQQQKNVYLSQSANPDAAMSAVASAEKALKKWKTIPASQRRHILLRVVELLEERQEDLVKLQIEETSCSETWARFNIVYTVNMLSEIAARITTACTGELPPMSATDTLGLLVKEPIGVVLLIAPWNAGVVLAARSLASILGAGCTVVFKASELCPRTHHFLVELYIAAGLPADAVSVIQTRREDAAGVTESLISHPAIRKIEFIGSAPVGRIIGALAGKYMKPVLMELGGKCATVVLDDAKLEDAAAKAAAGALNHHGQVCFSTERIIVLKSVADEFLALLKQHVLQFPQHHGVNERIVQNAHEMLSEANDKGAKFLLGKPEYLSKSSLAPCILTDVTSDMKIWDEETFGPSTTIIVCNNDDEAIAIVNQSKYGLEAAVFTRNMQRALSVARQLEVGRVRVNGSPHEATFPTNPMKSSGFGANNSGAGIEEFLLKKTITMDFR